MFALSDGGLLEGLECPIWPAVSHGWPNTFLAGLEAISPIKSSIILAVILAHLVRKFESQGLNSAWMGDFSSGIPTF